MVILENLNFTSLVIPFSIYLYFCTAVWNCTEPFLPHPATMESKSYFYIPRCFRFLPEQENWEDIVKLKKKLRVWIALISEDYRHSNQMWLQKGIGTIITMVRIRHGGIVSKWFGPTHKSNQFKRTIKSQMPIFG